MLTQPKHIGWEAIAGIVILVFVLACFLLPAGIDPTPNSYREPLEIHTIITEPGAIITVE